MKLSMSFIAKRRQFLKGFALSVAALFGALTCVIATSEPTRAGEALFSSIIVDLAPIKATGLGDLANPIGVAVKRSLNATYAGAIDAKNKSLPVLVVEVETIYYGQEEETFTSGMFPHFKHTTDQMSGTASVRKGKSEMKRVSVLGNNTTQGSWPLVDDVKSGRLQALTDRFADAVRDQLGN